MMSLAKVKGDLMKVKPGKPCENLITLFSKHYHVMLYTYLLFILCLGITLDMSLNVFMKSIH